MLDPHSLFALYRYGRDLARFDAQGVLAPLPARFLTQRPSKNKAADLPETPAERLSLYLRNAGVAAQTAAAFFALYPDIAGRAASDQAARSSGITVPADTLEKDGSESLLRLFYALAKGDAAATALAQEFESVLDAESDFRLEAAALERLNDSFCDDGCLSAALPDWAQTRKERLVLQPLPDLRPLSASPDKAKTAATLVRTVVLMILRDGFVVAPSTAVCRANDTGTLFMTRARLPAALSAKERETLSLFLAALNGGDCKAAAKALLTSGLLPPLFSAPRLIRLIEETDRHTAPLLTGQKADCFLHHFAQNGIFFSRAVRTCVFAMKRAEDLCHTEIGVNDDIWQAAAADYAAFRDKGLNIDAAPLLDAEELKRTFGVAPHHAERLRVQGKKTPEFQQDFKKIPEMLNRRTFAGRAKADRHPFVKWIAGVLLAGLAAGLLL